MFVAMHTKMLTSITPLNIETGRLLLCLVIAVTLNIHDHIVTRYHLPFTTHVCSLVLYLLLGLHCFPYLFLFCDAMICI